MALPDAGGVWFCRGGTAGLLRSRRVITSTFLKIGTIVGLAVGILTGVRR
ncbi:hypothetical protein KCP76_17085 [Salmonella enterica subsp. enterica serovar Weltevreden]|nr:hypothetical protein KCP76_17085 [Salmonella enterica subsp. enterica serovar Weltevreden]